MEVYARINEEHLTPDLSMIESVCGIETVRILLQNFGGMTFYIPKLSRLEQFVTEYITEHLVSKSYKEVALELRVSETYIRTLQKKQQTKSRFKNR